MLSEETGERKQANRKVDMFERSNSLFTCALSAGGYVTFANSAGSWLRIIVLTLDDSRVELGFAWEQGYQPRATPQRVRLGRFRVRALEFVGADRVQLGINVPQGFSAVWSDLSRPGEVSASAADALHQKG